MKYIITITREGEDYIAKVEDAEAKKEVFTHERDTLDDLLTGCADFIDTREAASR